MVRGWGRGMLILLLAMAVPESALAQAQAANGNIEGTVRDASGGVLPGGTVTNTATGTARVVVTNEQGVYRALLLPLGAYTVSVEWQGFRTYEQTGLILSPFPRQSGYDQRQMQLGVKYVF